MNNLTSKPEMLMKRLSEVKHGFELKVTVLKQDQFRNNSTISRMVHNNAFVNSSQNAYRGVNKKNASIADEKTAICKPTTEVYLRHSLSRKRSQTKCKILKQNLKSITKEVSAQVLPVLHFWQEEKNIVI